MTSPTSAAPAATRASDSLFSAFLPLLPLILAVFVGFLAMGMVLPVLPLHLHDTLGQGTAMVGVVMGSQYLSSFFARLWAGEVVDRRGPRRAALAGLLGAAGVGTVYLATAPLVTQPALATGILLVARLCTGVAESFIITAALAWGIVQVGPAHAGKVIGWIGMALFAAYAAGAPLGVALHAHLGFGGIALAAIVVPLLALAGTALIADVRPGHAARLPFHRIIGAVKWPGLGLTFCAVGQAMIIAFAALLFAERGWGSGALGLTSMGAGFIIARLAFGHLPDQLGGARVALWALLVQVAGLVGMGLATGPVLACAGAVLAGGGYALGFQGFGVEAVRRTPAESRGSAMGAYVAFQDIAMVSAPPLGGLLALAAGLESVYLAAAGAALVSAAIAWAMRKG